MGTGSAKIRIMSYDPLSSCCSKEIEHDGVTQLIVHIFHGLYDATSFDLMMDKVAGNYISDHRAIDLPSGPSFLDALQYGPLRNFESCRGFWVEYLQDANHTTRACLRAASRRNDCLCQP